MKPKRLSFHKVRPLVPSFLIAGLLLVLCFEVGHAQSSSEGNRHAGLYLGTLTAAEAAPYNKASESAPGLDEHQPGITFGGVRLTQFIFLLLGLSLGILVLVTARRRRNEGWEDVAPPPSPNDVPTGAEERRIKARRDNQGRRTSDQALVVASPAMSPGGLSSNSTALKVKAGTSFSPELFGAYRVEQEVGKLVLGQPHRMDVMASRAVDDRRAVEASLMKAISSPEIDDDGRRRARTALEDYGFVARQCAALLLAHDAYERTSAAKILGEVGSAATLPFLLEALYDGEEIVRIQAVTSLGSLKLPSAIGALLDIARHHPEMPSELISRALSACTVDCFDVPSVPIGGELLALESVSSFSGEITGLEPPLPVEELAESDDSEALAELLTQLADNSPDVRAFSARSLGELRFRVVIERLAEVSAADSESNVRAAAVTALAAIDHEFAFLPVLIALADEAREVRAAAARALSSLNIDRADAYTRVAQESPIEVQRTVARACIKAGIARQALDRLASEDRRQAYEAFALLAILAQSCEADPLFEAMGQNEDPRKAICAARVMAFGGQPESLARLRQLAVRDSITEDVRTAILEVIYKIDQAQPV
jgi:HEAT repeat protein